MTTLQSKIPGASGFKVGRKTLVIAASALVVVAAVGASVARKALGHRPPSPTGDPVAIAKFAATAEYAKLPVERKQQYLLTLRSNLKPLAEAARQGKLTREEQVAAVRNSIQAGARIEMAKHFSLPAGPARQAHMDQLIDEQERLRAYAANSPNAAARGNTAVEMKQFIESLPPEERIQMAQFGLEMFKRRQERGLPVWPY